MGEAKRPVRVMICDDETISRQYCETLLGGDGRYRLIRATDSARYADGYCACGYVDMLLMSALLRKGPDGLDVAAFVKRKFPRVKIVIMTSLLCVSLVRRARSIGVDAFWFKEPQAMSLPEVLEQVSQGKRCFPEKIPTVPLGIASSDEFTPRELDVLQVLAAGRSDVEIARELAIEPSTVRTHVKHLLEKTGFSSRTELAVRATQSRLVCP